MENLKELLSALILVGGLTIPMESEELDVFRILSEAVHKGILPEKVLGEVVSLIEK